VVSDSARVISELRFVTGDRLMITNCCDQALHRDRTQRKEFFFQEVTDLFLMARSRLIISGIGVQ